MKIFELMLGFVLHHYHWYGRNTLIKLIRVLAPCGLYVRSVYGVYLKENADDATWRSCVFGYEDSVIPDFVRSLSGNDCFIDIGANIGVFSLMAASRLSEDGIVISFEVNPQTYYKLVGNIQRNAPECVMLPFNLGISDSSALMRVTYDTRHSGRSHVTNEEDAGRRVALSSWKGIDCLREIIDSRQVYIKVDVEGMERDILDSLHSLFQVCTVRMVVLEIDDENLKKYGSSPPDIYQLMRQYGFKATIKKAPPDGSCHYDEVFVSDQKENG